MSARTDSSQIFWMRDHQNRKEPLTSFSIHFIHKTELPIKNQKINHVITISLYGDDKMAGGSTRFHDQIVQLTPEELVEFHCLTAVSELQSIAEHCRAEPFNTTDIHILTYKHTYKHTYTHTYRHTYKHTHVQYTL